METVGDYEYSTKDLIGQGAFAVVFKGRSKKNPQLIVAIKSIMKKSLAKSQNLLGKEIKILKELTELHHENVVALLDCKEYPQHVYLVMEYCNGGDLADYLGDKGTLSEDTIRLFLIQLAGAMKALYAKGIVHRDLKPQNILLSHSGQKSYPEPSEIKLKIADFGFARFLQDGVMAATLCGSPMYMAPEVIMSLKYDAKADLWSLGTIVFQCLTGKAAFHATTPTALKQFYEKNANLAPKIPPGTTTELCDLLNGLLKRNARERMNFDQFFNHKFLQRPSVTPPAEIPVVEAYATSPIMKPTLRAATPIKIGTPPTSQPDSPRSARIILSSSPEDDFVLIPEHLTESYTNDKHMKLPIKNNPQPCAPSASPPRPSFLPISEPIPVPSQRQTYQKMINRGNKNEKSTEQEADNNVLVPRSQPINMKRSENKNVQDIDISSWSPPSVQFVIGTPPGSGRRRTSSSSLCETPPPPNLWSESPVSTKVVMPSNSPLRRSGTSPPVLLGPLAKVPLFSPTQNDNNNLRHPSFGNLRAMTLPEISEMNNLPAFFTDTSTYECPPIDFKPPDLEEETLLDREHNEILAKINFVLALSKCVLELASAKGAPIPFVVEYMADVSHSAPPIKRAEQLVLMVRALQLLGSGLALATHQLKTKKLRATNSVKNVMSTLNTKFRTTLSSCKKLNNTGILSKIASANITADKLLYDYAMKLCQTAALDELFGNPSECFQRYQTAQILLHSLGQQVQNLEDKELLKKYQDAVEKRLFVLQRQGYIYATDNVS
ncbi:serine/threonine-protein kinase unc-51 [Onthophagus taurus]|uniref:serine/threonine-protein kinase unc-51 n=1 Tax=Onthophagus taurus TaxID=166361 RepID=UPI000C20B64E|nr:serine/threonine-protein kinase unc-51 [Onthophagus taurus]